MSDIVGLPNYVFGHPVDCIDDVWRYRDTGEAVLYDGCGGARVPQERVCPKCRLPQTADGHDPCLANLPGVRFACCGHGVEDGYVTFENGARIGGDFRQITGR